MAILKESPDHFRLLRRRFFWNGWCALLAVLLCLASGPARAQVSREYQLKAVFLFNFSRFTDWPPETFADPAAPLVIGILGKDPFGPFLEEAVRGETINNRPLKIEHFPPAGRHKERAYLVHRRFGSQTTA